MPIFEKLKLYVTNIRGTPHTPIVPLGQVLLYGGFVYFRASSNHKGSITFYYY